ncbi:MAG: adenylate/guanylate cyclase domain-containing protein [Rhizobiaceae bacterium]
MASEIGGWLLSLDMGKYVDAFDDNEITMEDLPELTDADLKELGVAAMGHRKAIMRNAAKAVAAAVVAATADTAPTQATDRSLTEAENIPAPSEAAAVPAAPAQSNSAERRQLTVMFADLVGSTELAGRLDPEDMREAITLYQQSVAREVTKIEGNVAKYMGDGVLCYFGWPQAHEDDPERAARAALGIIDALRHATAPNGEKLEARIGIATGLVVVGDLVGEGSSQEDAVIGETPNLAARLQGEAEPGQVVVSDTTRQLLSQSLEVEHLGQKTLKGISRPVDAYAVLGEHEKSGVLHGAHLASATHLVGRDTEIALLMDRWGHCIDSEGQVFVLSGEAGIGKSQVSSGLISNLSDQPHQILHFQCSPYYASTTFYPVIGYLERAAQFSRNDPADVLLDKLESLLAPIFAGDVSITALFAAMLSLPLERYPAIKLEPLKQREETIAAFVELVSRQAKQTPLLFLFEDAHWCDATSLELLTQLVQRVDELPVLVLVTHRPEFQSPWPNSGHVTQYNLNRLPKRHSAAIIDGVTGGKKLPDQIVEQILSKTDGIPLFVEELTRTVLDAGFLIEQDNSYVLDGPLPPFAIPSSLQDSLMARLDRLSPLKDVAQTGACIGREFTFELLASVSPQADADLRQALDQLVFNELIVVRGTPPEATYTFKHALVQDAAYSSLLKGRRQQLHAAIAKALQEKFPVQVEQQPELAAQHLAAAGLAEQAAPHWLAAGLLAISKSANEEAVNDLSRGLECLASLPESAERDEQELLMRAMLGVAQFTARGYGAPELGDNYSNALNLARRVGETPYKSPAMFGVWAYHTMTVDHAGATQVAAEALQQAEDSGLPHEMTAALAAAATSSIFKGEAKLGVKYSEASWANYDKATHGDLVALYGQDVGLWCADFGSWAVWLDGRSEESDRRYGEANRLAEELGHPLSLASGLVHASLLYSMAGNVERTMDYADKTIAVCEEVGIPARLVEAFVMKGWALAENGDIDEGIELTQSGMDGWRGAGAEIARPWWLALQSQQYSRKGDHKTALSCLDDALATVAKSGENIWLPELHRLRGEQLLSQDAGQVDAAAAQFQTAMEIANRQVSKFWELRAATSLGRLMNDAGEVEQATALIKPLHDWFNQSGEGSGTYDLQNAQQFL